MRGLFARGIAFEQTMVARLRADAALPQAQRVFLQDFSKPRLVTHAGVAKQGVPGIRFADLLVLEESPPPGQPPRVETFSFKSRNLTSLDGDVLTAQIMTDARAALNHYGGTLEILRHTLKFRGKLVKVHRVRLIYDGKLKPIDTEIFKNTMELVEDNNWDVEVLFE